MTRLGPSGWLEVHAVVREELLAEAARRSPERVAAQHALAAAWFEDIGETATALEHWGLAGQPRQALRLLARCVADLYDTGRETTITHTIAQVPLNVATADLQAMLEFAWCHLLVDKRQFLATVKQATAAAARSAATTPEQAGLSQMLESIAATLQGDWTLGGTQAEERPNRDG